MTEEEEYYNNKMDENYRSRVREAVKYALDLLEDIANEEAEK
jgi:hypothetical protein